MSQKNFSQLLASGLLITSVIAGAYGARSAARREDGSLAVRSTTASESKAVAEAAPSKLIVEFKEIPSQTDLKQLAQTLGATAQFERFDSFESDYFRRLYEVTLADEARAFEATSKLMATGLVERVERPQVATLSAVYPSNDKSSGPRTDP